VIDTLRQRHQEHRAPYLRALAALQKVRRSPRGGTSQRCHRLVGKRTGIVVAE
jgi:hypothetical protein